MEFKRGVHQLITAILGPAVFTVVFCAASMNPRLADAQANGSDLEKQIQAFTAVSMHADPPSMAPVPSGRIWTHLGSLYEDAGMYGQSEMAFLHAIRLLKTPPVSQADLARALDDLGTLYMMRGETQLAERAEQQALASRQANGLNADLPLSWYHLATLALRKHQSDKAREYARHAVEQLRAERQPDPDQQINAYFVLGLALCRLHHYPEATATMQAAMDIVRRVYLPEDFPWGFGSFLLGFSYWKSGDATTAQALMRDGSAIVQKHLGWQHPATVSIMTQYKYFLRATHQKVSARSIDDELKQTRDLPGFRQASESLSVASLF